MHHHFLFSCCLSAINLAFSQPGIKRNSSHHCCTASCSAKNNGRAAHKEGSLCVGLAAGKLNSSVVCSANLELTYWHQQPTSPVDKDARHFYPPLYFSCVFLLAHEAGAHASACMRSSNLPANDECQGLAKHCPKPDQQRTQNQSKDSPCCQSQNGTRKQHSHCYHIQSLQASAEKVAIQAKVSTHASSAPLED